MTGSISCRLFFAPIHEIVIFARFEQLAMKTRFFAGNVLAPLRHLLQRLSERDVMMILSLFVGVACGLAAVLLKVSIEFLHHHLTSWFDGKAYNALFLIYPGVGMLLAMLFVRYIKRVHGIT